MLLRQLDDARPLRVPGASYSAHTQGELAIFETARSGRARFGAQAIRHAIISHTETVSDLLEVLLLQKETGLMRGTLHDDAVCDLIVVPLFETIEDLRNAAPIMRDYYALPGVRAMVQLLLVLRQMPLLARRSVRSGARRSVLQQLSVQQRRRRRQSWTIS